MELELTKKEYQEFLNNIDNKSFEKFTDFCCNCKYFECKSSCDFWSRIAFVNYAQNFQPKSTGNRFQENDFESFKQYIELLKPEGCLIVSGVSTKWTDELIKVFSKNNLEILQHSILEEWNGFILRIKQNSF